MDYWHAFLFLTCCLTVFKLYWMTDCVVHALITGEIDDYLPEAK